MGNDDSIYCAHMLADDYIEDMREHDSRHVRLSLDEFQELRQLAAGSTCRCGMKAVVLTEPEEVTILSNRPEVTKPRWGAVWNKRHQEAYLHWLDL